MNEINKNTSMNGHNWGSLLKCYVSQKNPEILDWLNPDLEAGTFVAYYKQIKANEMKKNRFTKLIQSFVENIKKLYTILRKKGDEIK